MLTVADAATLKAQCTRFLTSLRPRSAQDWLNQLAHSPAAQLPLDHYGNGPAVSALEEEVATLLGKEAATFMIKGVTAQQAVLRVWTEQRGVATVALHPQSHIAANEQDAFERLHGLHGIRLGGFGPFSANDLETVKERIGAVVVELPLRNAGFKLPTWDELVAISEWCHEHTVPLHFDGARLWESAPYYERSYAEIAALADSIYVSFYKGLGGLAGCILAGSADVVAEAKLWAARHGGNPYTIFPYVIAAQDGLREYLPQMGRFYERARSLATALAALPGVTIVPDPPQTNAFQIYLPGTRPALEEARLAIAESRKVWLFGLLDSPVPHLTVAEISVGSATDDFSDSEIVDLIAELITDAKQRNV